MKRIKSMIILIAIVAAGGMLQAQDKAGDFNTHQRIRDQLMNGTAPGLQFGPASKKTVNNDSQPTAAEKAGSFSKQLRSGTIQSANIARGGGAPAARKLSAEPAARKANSNMPSDAASARQLENRPASQPAISDQGGATGAAIGLPANSKKIKPAVKTEPIKE